MSWYNLDTHLEFLTGYGMFIWNMLSLWLRWFKSCFHVYILEVMVRTLTLILV
jgi:hypothetical protein